MPLLLFFIHFSCVNIFAQVEPNTNNIEAPKRWIRENVRFFETDALGRIWVVDQKIKSTYIR